MVGLPLLAYVLPPIAEAVVARASTLAAAEQAVFPERPTPARALEQALAAVAVETPELPAEVLLSLAYHESRFDARSVSREVAGVRDVSPYDGRGWPPGATGMLYCGVTQAGAATWLACIALRPDFAAYRAAVAELAVPLADKYPLTVSLSEYNCGVAAMHGGCRGYATIVLYWAGALWHRTHPKPSS